MKIIIHDLNEKINLENSIEFNSKNVKSCTGCFRCWFKRPKTCSYNDELKTIGNLILNCDEIIIISKCVMGGYSSTVKQILERCIGYVEPFFEIRNKRIRHKIKTNKKLKWNCLFYGDTTSDDEMLISYLVKENAQNFNATIESLKFFQSDIEIREWLNDKCY